MHFVKSCFLEDVKSVDIQASQKKLFGDLCGNWVVRESLDYHLKQIKQCIMIKKVLVVVDDVGSEVILKALQVDAFKDGQNGSKVIVTTRHQDNIGCMDQEGIIDMEFLNKDQALDLFSHYAFDDLDMSERVQLDGLSKDITKACGGLPLSIEAMSQFLRMYNYPSYVDERRGLWEKVLDKLRMAKLLDGSREARLWATLEISYYDLDEDHRSMFLDFACILSNWLLSRQRYDKLTFKEAREYLGRIWDDPIGVQNLIRRSPIKWNPEKKTLVMHNQLRDLGRRIGNSSWILEKDEGLRFLLQNKSSKHLEGLFLRHVSDDDLEFYGKVGKKRMREVKSFKRSRLLDLEGSALRVVEYYVSLCSKELRWLSLHGTDISSSGIHGLGSFQKLRVWQMTWCDGIQQLPKCICDLSKLTEVDLSYCSNLMSLPDSIGALERLQVLMLEGCERLESLPESIGGLKSLKKLGVQDCKSLKKIPAGVGKLFKLEYLNASDCYRLETLCELGTKMHHLVVLNLDGCRNLKTIESLGNLSGLKTLNLNGCMALHIDNLHDHLGQLSQLQHLDMWDCSGLGEGIVETIQKGKLCTDHLQILWLPVFPHGGLPPCPGLLVLHLFNGLHSKEFFMSPGNSPHLRELFLSDDKDLSSVKVLPNALWELEHLEELTLKFFGELEGLPENVGQLSSLQKLSLKGWSNLVELPTSLGHLSQVERLILSDCKALSRLPESLGKLPRLKEFYLDGCGNLQWKEAEQRSILQQLRDGGCSSKLLDGKWR